MRQTSFFFALLSLLLVACGGDGSDDNTANQCVSDQTKCVGDLLMWCSGGSWALAMDCADSNKTCEQKTYSTAECKSLLCGNGVTDTGEICDGVAKACTDISSNYIGGNASCKADCSGYDTSSCTAQPYCGDNIVNNSEICDKDSKDCTQISADYSGGSATCKSDCSGYDTATCAAAPYCGDGIKNGSEACDGGTKPCKDLMGSGWGGDAPCKADCTNYDTSTFCLQKTVESPEFAVTDSCNDGFNIQWRIFDRTEGIVIGPEDTTKVYVTNAMDEPQQIEIDCYFGNEICVGAAPYKENATTHWCLGINGNQTYDPDCCITCEDALGVIDWHMTFGCD